MKLINLKRLLLETWLTVCKADIINRMEGESNDDMKESDNDITKGS